MLHITLPILKLSLLGIQQLSSHVSKFIRMEAKQSKTFRNYMCVPAAQCYHWLDVKIKLLLLNMGRHVKVAPLNEAVATELGAEVLGEFIVFVTASTAIIFETNRQSTKKNIEALSVNMHHKDIIEAMEVLKYRQEQQNAYVQEITRALAALGKPIHVKETKSKEFKEKSK
ncbi:putative OPA3-like protein CG13603 isoform X2 [Anastrepha obliqua]|uniref:putative OPA3-like protein CG13603 isoform X2 n=1 Tax=Anastrepha obliqua TaxID=95512 RepID=UPI002409A45B|nr:putative OPA3-like protein CG13603 isoform X2 [Anastrepha obliqua]